MKKKRRKTGRITLLVICLAILAAIGAEAYKLDADAGDISVLPLYRETTTFSGYSYGFSYGGKTYYISAADGCLYRDDGNDTIKLLDNTREIYVATDGNNNPKTVFAITNGGKLYSCGSNENGLLATPNSKDADIPVEILSNVDGIAINYRNNVPLSVQALTADGDVYFWGKNEAAYKLGDEDIIYTPTKLPCEEVVWLAAYDTGITSDGKVIRNLFIADSVITEIGTKLLGSDGWTAIANALVGWSDSLQELGTRRFTYDGVDYVLKINGDLVTYTPAKWIDWLWSDLAMSLGSETVVAKNVVDAQIYTTNDYKATVESISYLTADGKLYAIGETVGDGSLQRRDDFVLIHENVADILESSKRLIILESGEVLRFSDLAYEPLISGVERISQNTASRSDDYGFLAHNKAGGVYFFLSGETELVFEDVKLPEDVLINVPDTVKDRYDRDRFLAAVLPTAIVVFLITLIVIKTLMPPSRRQRKRARQAEEKRREEAKRARIEKMQCKDCKYLQPVPGSPSACECTLKSFQMNSPLTKACESFEDK